MSSERSQLAKQVERCRRLANEITDPGTVQELLTLANEIEMRLDLGRVPINREARIGRAWMNFWSRR
jgi:hypothetical protein